MLERTEGQAARGIYMPKPQLEQAVLLIEGFRAGAEGLLTPDAARLAELDADGVLAQVSAANAQDARPVFDDLAALLYRDAHESERSAWRGKGRKGAERRGGNV